MEMEKVKPISILPAHCSEFRRRIILRGVLRSPGFVVGEV